MDALRFALVPVLLIAILAVSPVFAQSCTQGVPQVDMSPSKISVLPGEKAVFTVEVESRDSDNCPKDDFTLSGTSEIGTVSFNPSVLHIQPDESETSLMTITVPSDAVVGEYGIVARATNGAFFEDDDAVVEILQDVQECEVKVSNLRFKESSGDDFKDEFAQDDEVSVLVDVSLLGNVNSDVLVQLFVENLVLDSETDNYPANSDTTFRFSERIMTKNYVDNIDVKVVATATCNPAEPDEDDDRIEIIEGDEDVEIEVEVGTPANTAIGKEVASRVFIENTGGKEVKLNLDARLCTSSGCKLEMFCGDSIMIIEEDDIEEIVCTITPTVADKYRVEANVFFDSDEDLEKSGYFIVASSEAEIPSGTPGIVVETSKIKEVVYTCSGDTRQAVYTTSEGKETSDIEFCPFGCSDGRCVQTAAPAKKTSAISVAEKSATDMITEPKFNAPTFNLDNFFDWLKNLLFSNPN